MFRSAIAVWALSAVTVAWAQPAPARIVIVVGPPGSGKTTQAQFLAKKYGLPAYSMADLLKAEMAGKKDPVSKAMAVAAASGEILPDEEATELIRRRLLRTDLRKGFILDGYPATAGQAKALDAMLQDQRLPKPLVVVLDAPDEVIRKRMLARRRADDKPENVERRIGAFRKEAALLAGWAGQTRVVRVDADAKVNDVSSAIVKGLEEAWSQATADRGK